MWEKEGWGGMEVGWEKEGLEGRVGREGSGVFAGRGVEGKWGEGRKGGVGGKWDGRRKGGV